MEVTNKEEIDQVLPWSTYLPSICKVPIKGKQTKSSPENTIIIVYLGLLDVYDKTTPEQQSEDSGKLILDGEITKVSISKTKGNRIYK